MATTEEYGALLTALALIDAYAARDEDSISLARCSTGRTVDRLCPICSR